MVIAAMRLKNIIVDSFWLHKRKRIKTYAQHTYLRSLVKKIKKRKREKQRIQLKTSTSSWTCENNRAIKMGSSHSSQRSKSHPNVSLIHRKASISKCFACKKLTETYTHTRLIVLNNICICCHCLSDTSSSSHDKIASSKDGMSRTASGSDINEKNYSIFFPIDRLAKVCVAVCLSVIQSLSQSVCWISIFYEYFVFYPFHLLRRSCTRNVSMYTVATP